MPTTPNRTKKALQEIARVFNQLASNLTADLNQALREIETLKHEVNRLKANRTTSRTTKQGTTHRKTNNRTHTTDTGTTATTSHHGTHHETKSPHESSYVFPQEPFTPQAPPEPTTPGNN